MEGPPAFITTLISAYYEEFNTNPKKKALATRSVPE